MMEILLWTPFALLCLCVIACQVGYNNTPHK